MGWRRYWYPEPDPEGTFNLLSVIAGTVLTLGLIAWLATKGIAWIFPWMALAALLLWLAIRLVVDSRH